MLSSRKVLVLEDLRRQIYLFLSSNFKSFVLSLDCEVLENCRGIRILQTVRYVSREVHKFDYRHDEEWLTY